ncbi:DHH family phosphoesterase [Mycoplasma enhydrae]|uniref:DHH family phosphoesterase n=1 Tax=Mycoplasma enhydrae TaxID=2499220 RepID=UPI00197B925A|nr:DHHA1 domain-containing protein [Mycoplasma enhydrae]MBN4089652.1 DHH family phosphoesterase [Mycoplasma enhydrae]MCV3733754.1 DHHA1 domain-containing protein [Mycoplasma enhydrae]
MNLKDKFTKFWEYINSHNKITLCTHVEPDGDTLGSAIALKHLIELNADNKEVKISGGDYPRNLLFLIEDKIDLVEDSFFNNSLKIVVDTSTKSRIFDSRVNTQEALKIDHHPFEGKWLFEIGGDYWPATGQLIVDMIKELNLKTNSKVLEGLAIAIITDTEYFKERNIDFKTFENMAFLLKNGLNYASLIKNMQLNTEENNIIFNSLKNINTKGIVSYIIVEDIVSNDIVRPLVAKFVDLVNTEVSLAYLKRKQGDYRCEIRSKTIFDVSKIASYFGGGGHFNSSGFIQKDIKNINEVLNKINE